MLELCSIASGSSGNCICVGSDNSSFSDISDDSSSSDISDSTDLCQFADEFVQSVAVNVAELVFAFGILCYGVEPFLAD